MAGYLTTHVLDTARGVPAGGLRIELHRLHGPRREKVAEAVTDEDGRTEVPILSKEAFETGVYELTFHCGDYLAEAGVASGDPRFLDVVPLRFGMAEDTHYHVPLLLSPFGYSTYRGS